MDGGNPAMPLAIGGKDMNDQNYIQEGLTIREHFASMAMQGVLAGIAGIGYRGSNQITLKEIAIMSVVSADALIKELNKT